MQSEEEIEKDNTLKISVPLITNEELRNIDNNFESIINKFTKSYVKEKELAIAQYIMQKQQNKIEHLKSREQKLIEKLEEAIDFAKTGTDLISKAKVECLENILKILKGENDE